MTAAPGGPGQPYNSDPNQQGQSPYGQPQSGQPQYGQSQYGQPQYGQPQYGQPQYGQPQYGGPAYGQSPSGPKKLPVPGALLMLGAIVGGVGAFLPWASVKASSTIAEVNQGLAATGATDLTVSGMSEGASDGWIVLGGAALALIGGIVLLAVGKQAWAGVLGILGGLVMGGVGIYDFIDATEKLDTAEGQIEQQVTATLGVSPEQIGLTVDASVSFGLYFVIAGAVIALVGAVLGLTAKRT